MRPLPQQHFAMISGGYCDREYYDRSSLFETIDKYVESPVLQTTLKIAVVATVSAALLITFSALVSGDLDFEYDFYDDDGC